MRNIIKYSFPFEIHKWTRFKPECDRRSCGVDSCRRWSFNLFCQPQLPQNVTYSLGVLSRHEHGINIRSISAIYHPEAMTYSPSYMNDDSQFQQTEPWNRTFEYAPTPGNWGRSPTHYFIYIYITVCFANNTINLWGMLGETSKLILTMV